MCNPDLLLHSVCVFFQSDFVRGNCIFCGHNSPVPHHTPIEQRPPYPNFSVSFTYYNYRAERSILNSFDICVECFKVKIEDKSLDELKSLIPLLKVKRLAVGHLTNVLWKDDFLIPFEDYNKDYMYAKVQPIEEVEAYINRIDK